MGEYGYAERTVTQPTLYDSLLEINPGTVLKDRAEDLVYQTFHQANQAYSYAPFQFLQVLPGRQLNVLAEVAFSNSPSWRNVGEVGRGRCCHGASLIFCQKSPLVMAKMLWMGVGGGEGSVATRAGLKFRQKSPKFAVWAKKKSFQAWW